VFFGLIVIAENRDLHYGTMHPGQQIPGHRSVVAPKFVRQFLKIDIGVPAASRISAMCCQIVLVFDELADRARGAVGCHENRMRTYSQFVKGAGTNFVRAEMGDLRFQRRESKPQQSLKCQAPSTQINSRLSLQFA
jgi:hypothetical protein